jgi:hypothetical protein
MPCIKKRSGLSRMHEMGLDDMEGELDGIEDWFQNLYQNIKDPRGQQTFMPKPIRDFNFNLMVQVVDTIVF